MEPMSATSTSAIGAAPPRTQTLSNKVQPLIPWRLRSHAAAEHSARQAACPRRITTRLQVVADRVTAEASVQATNHANQMVRDGHYESSLVAEQVNALRVRIACLDERDTIFLNPVVMNPRKRSRDLYDLIRMPDEWRKAETDPRDGVQASKTDPEQPSLASVLDPFNPATTVVDVCVVGCGPAGLALAAELGANGVSVALIGAPTVPCDSEVGSVPCVFKLIRPTWPHPALTVPIVLCRSHYPSELHACAKHTWHHKHRHFEVVCRWCVLPCNEPRRSGGVCKSGRTFCMYPIMQ